MVLHANAKFPEDKPGTIGEYLDAVDDTLKVDLKAAEETRYEDVTRAAKKAIEKSLFWNSLCTTYSTFSDQYKADTGYDLFTKPLPPDILIKPYESLLDKSYRKNVLNNKKYPTMPDDGWLIPPSWFSKTNDIIRTSIAVKYLDGVNFLVAGLKTLAQNSGCEFRPEFEARPEGYYAAQTYIVIECEVPSETFDTEMISFPFEVEITTQLKDVIKRLLHHHYEKRRLAISNDDVSKIWQWDYESDEFAANYLGHILHYLEGMIMAVRTKQVRAGEGE